MTPPPKPRSPLYHFPNLPADIHERLAARGIDPERAAESWVQAIMDGSFPVSAFHSRPAGYKRLRPQANREARSPGASYIPMPLPLALVLPSKA